MGRHERGRPAFFGAKNALEAGQNFVSSGASLNGADGWLSIRCRCQNVLCSRKGTHEFVDKVMKIPDNRSVWIDRIFSSEDGRARTAMALGPNRSGELEAFMRRENMMDLSKQAITGNSSTARQMIMKGLAGAGHGIIGGGIEAGAEDLYGGEVSPKALIGAALLGAVGAGHIVISTKLAQSVREKFVSDDPKVLEKS